jgi:hypothetical protein
MTMRIRLFALVSAALTCAAYCNADTFTEDFNNFGKQQNFCVDGIGGVCFATSAINSFIFLENLYPAIYGNLLTPNIQGTKPNQTDPQDTTDFATMVGAVTNDTAGYNSFVSGKMTWINQKAPGTSWITSNYPGSSSNNGIPTIGFLTNEIQTQEDVELFISGGGIGHAIVLTSISCSGPKPTDCIIKYQDPNSPTVQQTSQLLDTGAIGSGMFGFQGLPGTDPKYTQTLFTISAAFAESPVPEPSTLALLGMVLSMFCFVRIRHLIRK